MLRRIANSLVPAGSQTAYRSRAALIAIEVSGGSGLALEVGVRTF